MPTVWAKTREVSIHILKSHILFALLTIQLCAEAEFVNPKVVTTVPGPGSHEPDDAYTTKEHSSMRWSINKIDRHGGQKPNRHPGPGEHEIPSKIVEKP